MEHWNCPECGGGLFRMMIAVESAEREAFMEDIGSGVYSGLTADDFTEVFGWITIGLVCTECAYEMKRWVDLETS